MIRRLEIAQSMLHRPTVLFMDEPTVGLDPWARDAVWRVLALAVGIPHHDANHFALHGGGRRIVRSNRADRTRAHRRDPSLGPGSGPALISTTSSTSFNKLVGIESESEAVKSYAEVRRRRRAARQHG